VPRLSVQACAWVNHGHARRAGSMPGCSGRRAATAGGRFPRPIIGLGGAPVYLQLYLEKSSSVSPSMYCLHLQGRGCQPPPAAGCAAVAAAGSPAATQLGTHSFQGM
jgi:hypothetical protein